MGEGRTRNHLVVEIQMETTRSADEVERWLTDVLDTLTESPVHNTGVGQLRGSIQVHDTGEV